MDQMPIGSNWIQHGHCQQWLILHWLLHEVQELIAVPWLFLQRLSNTALHPTSIDMDDQNFMTFHVNCSVNHSEYLRITVMPRSGRPSRSKATAAFVGRAGTMG